MHVAVGNGQQIKQLTGQDLQAYLADPQQLNSYSYGRGNPVRFSDPQGLWIQEFLTGKQSWSGLNEEYNRAVVQLSQDSPTWKWVMDHPIASSAMVGLIAAPAAAAGGDALLAFRAAAFPGVGGAYVAKQAIAGAVYTSLAISAVYGSIPSAMNTLSTVDFSHPSTYLQIVLTITVNIGPTVIGGYTGSISDTLQFVSLLNDGLSNMISSSSNNSSANNGSKAGTTCRVRSIGSRGVLRGDSLPAWVPRMSGSARRKRWVPCATAMPRSSRKARISFTVAVRSQTRRVRTRCRP